MARAPVARCPLSAQTTGVGNVEQTINRAATITTIYSDTNPVEPGGELTFDIYVQTVWPGGVQPGGTVAILLNGTMSPDRSRCSSWTT
jgi:hypothetical protein